MVIEHQRDHLPVLIFFYFACHFMPPHLFVERIQQLLSRRSARECGTMMLCSAETTKVEQAFLCPRKGNTHAIEQVDDRRRHLAHRFRRRLAREKIDAVNRVVKMFPGRIALTLGVDRAVDAALSANGMRTLYGDDRKQIYRVTSFGDLHRRGQTCESTADDCDLDSI